MSSARHATFCRRLRFTLAAALLCAWGSAIDAQVAGFGAPSGGDPARNISASARILPAAAGGLPRLSITAEMADGWHIFSLTQQPGGPKRTRIEIAPSDQFKLAGPLNPDPAPQVKHYNDIWPDLPVEEHEPRVTWTAPLALSPGVDPAKLVIRLRLVAQLCSDRCVDVALPLTARLEGAAATVQSSQSAPPDDAPPDAGPSLAPPRVRAPLDSSQAAAAEPLLKSGSLTLSGQLDRQAIPPGEGASLTISAVPAKGYHVYALADREPSDPVQSRPTLIVVKERSGLNIGPPAADAPPIEKKRELDETHTDRYYTNPVRWIMSVDVPANTPPGDHVISGLIGFMTCSEDHCDPPKGARFTVNVKVGAAERPGATPVLFTPTTYREVAQAAGRQAGWNRLAAGMVSNRETVEFSAGILAFQLMVAFAAGLILNVMPCVLPVIGLKIMSFVQQAGESRGRIFALNVWYVLGILSVFLVLGALAAFLGYGWGDQFSRPEFGIVLAAVVFVFALSLLGVWEIPLPGFVGSKAAHDVAEREGPTGAFAKGVLTTVLATPCGGPFMVPMLNWTLTLRSTPVTFAIFGMMGLGMASPYLLIGANPRLLRFLPRPGAWMETFKQLMGFVLLGTILWIFYFLDPRYFLPTLALLFGLWMACWWAGRTPLTAELGQKLTAWAVAAAIALLVGIGAFRLLVDENIGRLDLARSDGGTQRTSAQGDDPWQAYSPELLDKLKQQHVTVLVDFTARNCAQCQLNKKFALRTKATERFMHEHGVVGLEADKGQDLDRVEQFMIELGHVSRVIPFYAIFPGDGGPMITYDRGKITEATLLDLLKQASPTVARSAEKTATKPL